MIQKFSRREFISKAGKGAIGAAFLAPVMSSVVDARSGAEPIAESVIIDLTKPEYNALTRIGGAIKIPNPRKRKKPVIVARISETSVAAYSSRCTHWGCEVPLPVNNVITCPCHESQFDASGKVVHGPAKWNLDPFPASLEGLKITITIQSAG